MAGKLNSAAIGTGKALLGVLKLLVLALWIGGGLVVGALATFFLERLFTEQQLPKEAAELTAARILSSFSTTEVIAGGALCVLLFLFERKRRGGILTLIMFALLVVLTAANQFIISGLQGYGIHSTVYQAIFFSQIGVALIFLSVLALAGKAPPPTTAAITPVIPPAAVTTPMPSPVVPAQAVRPPSERPGVARPGAGTPPFALPSIEAASLSAPGKPTSLPAENAEFEELLGDPDRKDSSRGEERS